MKVTTLDEKSIRDIGHAFGYYDYGEETGMSAAFSGKEATSNYICAYVRGVLRGGFLHTTSERGEGYIAYKLPKEKMGLKTMWPIACGMLHNSTLKRLLQFGIAIKRGGVSLQNPTFSLGLSVCGSNIRGRAICERCWTSPLPRATGWACR